MVCREFFKLTQRVLRGEPLSGFRGPEQSTPGTFGTFGHKSTYENVFNFILSKGDSPLVTPLSTDSGIGQIKHSAFLLLTAAQNGNLFLIVLKRRYTCNKKINRAVLLLSSHAFAVICFPIPP